MFVRDAEILILDDLSSALDVDTEAQLWGRFFAGRESTVLAVSHRRTVLRLADRILVLKDGTIEAQGALDDIMESCEEMRLLWSGQSENVRE
jgi:ATP-binding cassette, subfamily B, bacterial